MASGILASGSTDQAATSGGKYIIYTCPAGKTATVKLTVTTDILSFAVTAPTTNSYVSVMQPSSVNTPNIPRLSINGAPFTFNANISAISSTLLSVNCGGVLELSYVLAAGQTLYFTNTQGSAGNSIEYLYASYYTSGGGPSFYSSVGYTVTGYEE